MDYIYTILINEELDFIQQTALKFRLIKNPLHNDYEIKNLILTNGYRYMEDFMNDDVFKELSDLNNFDEFDEDEIDDDNNNFFSNYYNNFSHKEFVQNFVTDCFFEYQYIYKIEGVNINPRDWDLLFDVMYNFYKSNNIEDLFLDDMSSLNRFAVSLALLKSSFVDINCYIEGLGYLKSDYLKKKDIMELQNKLTDETNANNIIDFNSSNIKTKRKIKTTNNLDNGKVIDFNSWNKQR